MSEIEATAKDQAEAPEEAAPNKPAFRRDNHPGGRA